MISASGYCHDDLRTAPVRKKLRAFGEALACNPLSDPDDTLVAQSGPACDPDGRVLVRLDTGLHPAGQCSRAGAGNS